MGTLGAHAQQMMVELRLLMPGLLVTGCPVTAAAGTATSSYVFPSPGRNTGQMRLPSRPGHSAAQACGLS